MKHFNIFVLLTLAIASTTIAHSFSEIQVVKADKVVQLNGAYATEIIKIQHKCTIQDCKDQLFYAITQQQNQRVAHISFSKDKPTTQSLIYTTQEYTNNGQKFVLYKINIKRKLQASQNYVLVVSISYLNRYVNYPLSIDLTEDQKFQYEDNRKFLSPYHVKEFIITYKFSKIIGYASDGEKKGLSAVSFKGTNVQPFSYSAHRVHGVNNEPQVYFSEVVRQIEVSHWGNIAITQFYKIKNIGPELKGQFSRVQFGSNNKFEAKNTWRGIQTNLPYEIWGLYYRDQVGNISTSRAFRDDSSGTVRAAFAPRFGLLGGWKSNWQIGYNLNTEGFLLHEGNKFQLNKIPIQYGLSTILSQKYTIKLILPEGSQNVKLFIGNNPVDMNKVTQGISFGYLDFAGRPTFTVENLRGLFKDQKLKVSYTSDYLSIFKKPIIVFGAIFSILILFIVLKRLNMSAFQQTHVHHAKKEN